MSKLGIQIKSRITPGTIIHKISINELDDISFETKPMFFDKQIREIVKERIPMIHDMIFFECSLVYLLSIDDGSKFQPAPKC